MLRLGCVLKLLLICSVINAQPNDTLRQQTLEEIVVKSQSANRNINDNPIGSEKIDIETITRLPSLFGERDIIKGLQLLPGVKSEADGLGGYQVRGGTSSQNHILLDGAAVYNMGHLFGLFSTFNDDAIGNAELYKGLMPAQFSGGSSSVLTINTRGGDPQKHHLSTSIGLLSAKLSINGPLGSNGSNYLSAARTSYLNLFIKGINKYRNNSLGFYDVNSRLNFRISPSDLLSLTIFRGYDNIDVEKMMNMSWSNTSASLGWLHTNGTKMYMQTQLVASNYETKQGMNIYSYDLSMEGYNRQITLRHQYILTPNNIHKINVGGESTLMGVQSASWRVVAHREREKRDGWIASLWASDDMNLLNNHLNLSAGLRCDWLSALGGHPYYEFNDQGEITDTIQTTRGKVIKSYLCVQPRLSLLWRFSQKMAFKVGYSRIAQAVQPIRNSSMTMPIDRLAMISNYVKPMTSDQIAVGLSMMGTDEVYDITADAYWKKLNNIYDFREGKTFNSEIELEQLIVGGRARAYGLELSAHKNKGKHTGWIAYTLSWVENQIDGIMNGQWYTAPNDKRHDLSVVLISQLSRNWTLSSCWRYTTGQAMTAPSGKYEIDGETYYYFGDRNKNRAPDYHRLDISISHDSTKGKASRIWTFGLYNVYNRYNPFFVSFQEDNNTPSNTKTTVTSLFGIVPTISFTYKY